MFLLVSGCHVGAHLGGHQHGGSIQISINLGKTFLLISSVRKIAVTWILARVFAYLPSLYFQILDLIDWTVFIFYFDLLWIAWHWKPAIRTKNNCVISRVCRKRTFQAGYKHTCQPPEFQNLETSRNPRVVRMRFTTMSEYSPRITRRLSECSRCVLRQCPNALRESPEGFPNFPDISP